MANELEAIIEETVKNCSPDLSDGDRKILAEALKKRIVDNIPMQESLKISNNAMELMYTLGFQEFQKQHFETALQHFLMLAYLQPYDVRFPMGVASCYHKLKDYQTAFTWYLIASRIDTETPMPFYYSSDCMIKLDDTQAAISLLKEAARLCGSKLEHAGLKTRIQMTVEKLIDTQKNSKSENGSP